MMLSVCACTEPGPGGRQEALRRWQEPAWLRGMPGQRPAPSAQPHCRIPPRGPPSPITETGLPRPFSLGDLREGDVPPRGLLSLSPRGCAPRHP